jgi:ribonuclease HI
VAEGTAARVLLDMVPVDKPLVIFTDSANIMYAMQHCSRRERWKDFSNHADAQLLEDLARLQAQRTALTVWVKVKSHTSVELNERADRLAAEAPFAEAGISKLYVQQEEKHILQFYKQEEAQRTVQASAQELRNHFTQLRCGRFLDKAVRTTQMADGTVSVRPTWIVRKLQAKGVGRENLSNVLWSDTGLCSLEDKVVRRMLQCLTNTFPTQSRLRIMGKSTDGQCKFCSEGVTESLFHWQCKCAQFSDARTKVHNDIWTAVSKAICSYMPKEWVFLKETPVKDIFTSMQNHEQHALRQPDGVFFRAYNTLYVLVDFNRGYGSTREDLAKQETTKRSTYEELVSDLNIHHFVEFFPLVSGYNGAIAVDTWTSLMDTLGIQPKFQQKVLNIAVKAICIGFSTMVDIRHGCLKATERSSHPG